MEQNKNEIVVVEQQDAPVTIPGFSPDEMRLLKEIEEKGAKPISPTLAAQMFTLFVDGYSCGEIAKHNKTFTEGDILYCRKKYNWDSERDKYMSNLTVQIRERLQKAKLESVEFLTNMLSVMNKKHKDQALRYLQTGNSEDLPEFQINTIKGYKEVIETLSKVTGEDKVQKHLIHGEINQNVNVSTDKPAPSMTQELQSKILRALAAGSKASSSDE